LAFHAAGAALRKDGKRKAADGKAASLYIHVPFCASLCDYCDFYSVPSETADRRFDLFIDALLDDTEALIGNFGIDAVPTVYIGGGTPSVLGAAGIRRLLEGLAVLLPSRPEEFTLEANPETADGAFLRACREGGVNRISLGVQTFNGESRRALHRGGDSLLLAERLMLAREIFGECVSLDLLTGLPLQDEGALVSDIEKILSLRPGHVSLYSLTVEEGTPLAARTNPGLPSRDEADRLWILGRDLLAGAGYDQYEVSNFALPGRRSLHNIRYWRMGSWMGAGPSASGTLIDDETGTGCRCTVDAGVDRWLGRPRRAAPPVTVEHLDRPVLIKESLLMGFRYLEGPDEALFRRRFGCGIEDLVPESLARWRRRGVIRKETPAPTVEGFLFLNPLLFDVFEELNRKKPAECPGG
jgi:oxygen-independent coproporphyrinogen-3 oxidase